MRPPAVTPAALVFDLDGTILDTETVEYDSVRLVWDEFGHHYPVTRFVDVIGTTDALPWIAELELVLGEAVDAARVGRLRHEYRRSLLAELRPRPGVVELIDAAVERGIPLAIASNSPLAWVDSRLTDAGLLHHFGALLAVDVSSAPKPDPAPYLEACIALGADPACTVAFEDSNVGVRSARASGCFTVACPGPLTEAHDLSGADRVVTSLAGIDIEQLAVWLGDRRS
ncbi:MAG: HAD family hydrolase [Acidimicrobiia bacterium]